MIQELPYWLSLANLPKWGPIKTLGLIIRFYHDRQLSLSDFFQMGEDQWKNEFNLEQKEIDDLKLAKSEVPNYAFLAESLLNEGYDILPVISPEYPQTLKENLKMQAPVVLYVKGNKQIMKEKSVAIVGSRTASDIALQFTDNVAKKASEDYKVIVSGFAKGVDKQALDSAINYKGQSIIVLPQGILTFDSGFKKYYRQIVEGDVLVLSIFHPKAPWKVELAMARNPIIYGLADEIYVAESNEKGGTWAGVIDGLRKHRKIFVRLSGVAEKNANNLLIDKGGIPVDLYGTPVESHSQGSHQTEISLVNEPAKKISGKSRRLKSKRDPGQKELFDQ